MKEYTQEQLLSRRYSGKDMYTLDTPYKDIVYDKELKSFVEIVWSDYYADFIFNRLVNSKEAEKLGL